MGMADLRFDASIVPKIDPSQMTSGINQIQQQFSKLKLPDSLKQSFADATKSATKAVQEYQAIMQKPVKTKTDQTNLDRAGQKAIQEFTKLEGIIKNISTTDMRAEFHVDTKEVQILDQKLKELRASLSENKSGFLEGIGSALDQLPSKSSAIDTLKNKLQDTTVTAEQLSPELQRLTNNIISFTSKATLDKKFEEDLKNLKTAIDEVVTALSEGNFEQAASKFGAIESSLESLNKKGFDTTKVGNYTTALKSAIDQTKQLSDLDMSKTAQDIDDITQKLEQIDAKAFAEMEAKVKQLESQVEQLNNVLQDNHNKTMAAAESQRQFNTQVEQLKSRVEYFFGLTNAVQLFKRALQNTFNTVKELDASMTETAVVTDFSVGDMWDQLPRYTATAKEFGATIKGVYDVMTLYYQQGLDQDQAWALGTETLKLARIAGLDYAEATDRMTNALRGFNMELNDQNAQRVDDVYSKLAAISASNVDELSIAMTKTASIAKSANMEFETTAAFLAQIIETTR